MQAGRTGIALKLSGVTFVYAEESLPQGVWLVDLEAGSRRADYSYMMLVAINRMPTYSSFVELNSQS